MKEIKKLTRCEKGHFYDAGRFSTCPHCENTKEISVTEVALDPPDLPDLRPASAPQTEKPVNRADASKGSRPAVKPDPATVEQFAVSGFPKSAARDQDDSMTVHFYQKTLGTEPVVGWLVCVKGVHFGQDFRIKSGRNFLGRSGSMDICLSGDTAVSRNRHLILTYDPKGNAFFVQPGDTSSALSYLNEKPLLEATTLKSGDKLTVGESDLMFVPFCGKNFTWKNS